MFLDMMTRLDDRVISQPEGQLGYLPITVSLTSLVSSDMAQAQHQYGVQFKYARVVPIVDCPSTITFPPIAVDSSAGFLGHMKMVQRAEREVRTRLVRWHQAKATGDVVIEADPSFSRPAFTVFPSLLKCCASERSGDGRFHKGEGNKEEIMVHATFNGNTFWSRLRGHEQGLQSEDEVAQQLLKQHLFSYQAKYCLGYVPNPEPGETCNIREVVQLGELVLKIDLLSIPTDIMLSDAGAQEQQVSIGSRSTANKVLFSCFLNDRVAKKLCLRNSSPHRLHVSTLLAEGGSFSDKSFNAGQVSKVFHPFFEVSPIESEVSAHGQVDFYLTFKPKRLFQDREKHDEEERKAKSCLSSTRLLSVDVVFVFKAVSESTHGGDDVCVLGASGSYVSRVVRCSLTIIELPSDLIVFDPPNLKLIDLQDVTSQDNLSKVSASTDNRLAIGKQHLVHFRLIHNNCEMQLAELYGVHYHIEVETTGKTDHQDLLQIRISEPTGCLQKGGSKLIFIKLTPSLHCRSCIRIYLKVNVCLSRVQDFPPTSKEGVWPTYDKSLKYCIDFEPKLTRCVVEALDWKAVSDVVDDSCDQKPVPQNGRPVPESAGLQPFFAEDNRAVDFKKVHAGRCVMIEVKLKNRNDFGLAYGCEYTELAPDIQNSEQSVRLSVLNMQQIIKPHETQVVQLGIRIDRSEKRITGNSFAVNRVILFSCTQLEKPSASALDQQPLRCSFLKLVVNGCFVLPRIAVHAFHFEKEVETWEEEVDKSEAASEDSHLRSFKTNLNLGLVVTGIESKVRFCLQNLGLVEAFILLGLDHPGQSNRKLVFDTGSEHKVQTDSVLIKLGPGERKTVSGAVIFYLVSHVAGIDNALYVF